MHACLAADAATVVEIYDAVVPPVQGGGGTDRRTRSVIAMIAPHHPKVTRCMRELALFDVFYPGTKNANGDLVFLFTRNGARVAADAAVLIDDKSVSHLGDDHSSICMHVEILQTGHHS